MGPSLGGDGIPGGMVEDTFVAYALQWGRRSVATESSACLFGTLTPFGFNGAVARWRRNPTMTTAGRAITITLQWGRRSVATESGV